MISKLMHQIVIDEFQDLAQRISANIRATDQWASGETSRTLRIEVQGDTYTLYGRGNFDSLEIGYRGYVSPQTIFDWSKSKGLKFADDAERMEFSFRAANKIVNEGTVLFRTGRTFTGKVPKVYSDEIKITVENLREKVGEAVLNQIETITLNEF